MPGSVMDRRVVFLFAKIIIGMGCGSLMSVCQTYISEIAPKNLRGVVLGFYGFNIVSDAIPPPYPISIVAHLNR